MTSIIQFDIAQYKIWIPIVHVLGVRYKIIHVSFRTLLRALSRMTLNTHIVWVLHRMLQTLHAPVVRYKTCVFTFKLHDTTSSHHCNTMFIKSKDIKHS